MPPHESVEFRPPPQETGTPDAPESTVAAEQPAAEQPTAEKAEPSAEQQVAELKKQFNGLIRKMIDQGVAPGSAEYIALSKERNALREQIRALESKPAEVEKTAPVEPEASAQSESPVAAEQPPEAKEAAPDAAALARKQRIEQIRAEIARERAAKEIEEDPQLKALDAQATQDAKKAQNEKGTINLTELRSAFSDVRERRNELAEEARQTAADAEARADLEKSDEQLLAEKRKRDAQSLVPRLGLLGSSTIVKKAFGRAIKPEEFGFTDPEELLTTEGEEKLANNEFFKAASPVMREMFTDAINKLRERYPVKSESSTRDNVIPFPQRAEAPPSFELKKAA
jgi:hypothetical protein